jgi:uncharacterized OB-fold protein
MEAGVLFGKLSGGIGADGEYWSALAQGEFRMPRCAQCRGWMWPAHFRCPCGSWEFEWVAQAPVGTVYSWTRTWYAFDRVMERAGDVPYVTILAEIPAAGNARVMGMLTGPDDGLQVGAPVRGVILPPSEKSKDYPSICWALAGAGRR